MAHSSQPLLPDSVLVTAEFQALLDRDLHQQLAELLTAIDNQLLSHLHFSIELKYVTLRDNCPVSFANLREFPEDVLRIGNEVATLSFQLLAASQGISNFQTSNSKVSIRIVDFPLSTPFHTPSLPKDMDVTKFSIFSGIITSQMDWKLLELTREYVCDVCGCLRTATAAKSFGYFLPKTLGKCPNNCRKGILHPVSKTNPSTVEAHHAIPFQQFAIESLVKSRSAGSLNRTLSVIVTGSLPQNVSVGDDVCVGGYLFVRFPVILKEGEAPSCEYIFHANNIAQLNPGFWSARVPATSHRFLSELWMAFQDPIGAIGELMNRLFPEIVGLGIVKVGLALVMIGGMIEEQEDALENENELRQKGHLLLVGLPGCGKSVLLSAASSLIPNSILVQGSSTSVAGLTATITSSASEGSSIAPGSLLLAKNAILALDEFSTMSSEAMNCLHQSMESGRISLTKCAVKLDLPVLCSVVAAMNPRQSSGVDFLDGIPKTIISRFDLIYLIPPSPCNPANDRIFAEKIIHNIGVEQAEVHEPNSWDKDTRRDVFLIFRAFQVRRFKRDAMQLVQAYFIALRQCADRDIGRTGNRLLGSVVRLSISAAKLMSHREITVDDVILGLFLLDASMGDRSLAKLSVDITKDLDVQLFGEFKRKLGGILNLQL